MTKLETVQCDICEAIRPAHFAGQRWFGIYWIEKRGTVLHVCDDCKYIMERLFVRLGFRVKIPDTFGPNCRALDRITISDTYGAINENLKPFALA